MGVAMATWPFLNFTVCRDAARRAGSSATADTSSLVFPVVAIRFVLFQISLSLMETAPVVA